MVHGFWLLWIFVISCVCLDGLPGSHPSICLAWHKLESNMQTFQLICFVPVVCKVTINVKCCHFVPLPVTLTLALAVHQKAQSKISYIYFLAHFSAGQDEIWCEIEAVHVEHPDSCFLSEIKRVKWNNCFFADCVIKPYCRCAFRCLWTDLIQTYLMIDIITLYILILV